MRQVAVTIVREQEAQLLPVAPPGELASDEVRGRTLASLVSPGTEISWNYLGQGGEFPTTPGYAAVFEVEETGSEVEDVRQGDHVFCMGGHRSVQQHKAANVVHIPRGLKAEVAVLARLMGVSLTTLRTTRARPGDPVLVTGLGPVGYLCAHQLRIAGYDVHGVDVDDHRRALAQRSGLGKVLGTIADAGDAQGKIALAVECSGHEQAVLDAARAVRRGGEVVLVGVPWKRRTELSAHELLHAVFHKYVQLRSGWEWQLPHHESDFQPHSIFNGYALALQWLAEGRLPTDDFITLHRPHDAQEVYQGLLHNSPEGLFQVFDWKTL